MPDSKITALTSISTSTDPANDPLVIVDVSDTSMAATGTTKKVTLNQLLGASGTATLASATITGDLTVDTSTLKVTASTDTVTVGATTTDAKFRVVDANYNGLRIGFLPGTFNYNLYDATTHEFRTAAVSPQSLYTFSASSAVWYDGAGGTRMTLNGNGLGVGVSSPRSKLDVNGGLLVNNYVTSTNYAPLSVTTASAITTPSTFTNAISIYNPTNVGAYSNITFGYNALGITNAGAYIGYVSTSSAGFGKGDLVFGTRDVTTDTAATERLRIDAAGNVGIGVAPNTWTIYKALQVQGASIFSTTGNDTGFGSNVYYDGGYKFRSASSDKATRYEQFGGSHSWHYTAAAGTAGNTATFTQAMTLDADGNLAIGYTATGNRRLEVKSAGTSNTTFAAHFRDSADTLLFHVRSDGYFNTGQGALSPYNNTTASAANMFVDSSGFVYRSTSSLKYKTDVKDSVHGLADVLKLRPVTYKSKNGDDTVFGGLIAEEVHAAGLTEFVAYAPDNTPDAIHYSNMVSLLVAAIQELTARVQTLEAK